MAAEPIPVSLQIEEATRLGIIKILTNVTVNERGCWVWQGWCNPRWGYGHTSWRGTDWTIAGQDEDGRGGDVGRQAHHEVAP